MAKRATDAIDAINTVLSKYDKAEADRKKRAGTKPKKEKLRKISKKEQQIIDCSNVTVLPEYYHTVWTEDQLDECCAWIAEQEYLAVDTETMGLNWARDEIVGISFYAPHRSYYIPLKHKQDVEDEKLAELLAQGKIVGLDYVKCLPKNLVTLKLKPLLEDIERKLILHNSKFDSHILRKWMGIDIKDYIYFDTMIAQALLDENHSKALKDMAVTYLKIPADRYATLFGKITFNNIPILLNPSTRTGNLATYYACKDTELTYKMWEFQDRAIKRPNLEKLQSLMFDIEIPFLRIVIDAETKGVLVDKDYLINKVSPQLHSDLEELRQKIIAYTGDINLGSPAQLAPILYDVLKLPRVNKDKPNSTDKRTLNKLKKEHPVVPMILEWRAKSKLTQAFADKLPQAIVDGRIHTSFNSVGTKTGRMSSSGPNLQQMPAKVGGLIRNAFQAGPGRLLASIDFSQQELRVLAHVSQDETLLNLYRKGWDVHSMTATGMWNRKHPEEQVEYETFEYRREMTNLFQDADGNITDSKFTPDYIQKLFNEGKVTSLDPNILRQEAEYGIKYEKIRKLAKVVNPCYSLQISAQSTGGGVENAETMSVLW